MISLKTDGERFVPDGDMGKNIELEHVHRYEAVAPYLEDMVVLDAACGAGFGSDIISNYCKKVTGIDIDADAISYANNRYSKDNIEFLQMSITKLDFEDNTFDAVVSFETLEHVNEDDQISFLTEIKRVLKRDGVLIISTPNLDTFMMKSNGKYKNPFHLKEYNRSGFESFLEKFFDIVTIFQQERLECSIIDGNEKGNLVEVNPLNESDYMIAVCSNVKHSIDISSALRNSTNMPGLYQYLYLDYGNGFNESAKLVKYINYCTDGSFSATYDFDFEGVKSIRFDPVDFPAHVKLQASDGNGNYIDINPINANICDDGDWFYHFDPQYSVKVDNIDKLREINFRGCISRIDEENVIEYDKTTIERNYANLIQNKDFEINSYKEELEEEKKQNNEYKKTIDENTSLINEYKEELEEEKKQNNEYKKTIDENTSLINEYKEELEEEKKQNIEKQRSINDQLKKIDEYNNKVVSLEEVIVSYKELLQQRDNSISEYEIKIEGLNNRIMEIYNSRSWKFTSPYRKIGKFFIFIYNKAKAFVKKNIANDGAITQQYDRQLCYRENVVCNNIPAGWLDILKLQEKLSIIIAIKDIADNAEFVNAYKSCLNQSYENYEIILVVSEAEADKVASTIIDNANVKLCKVKCEDDIIQYWLKGIESASGKYVGFVEQEDYMDKDWLANVIEVINEYPLSKIITVCENVDYCGDYCFPDKKLGIKFLVGGKYSLSHSSFVQKEYANKFITDTQNFVETCQDDEIKVIPFELYHTVPTRDVWERKDEVRCVAFYLPQFHEIPENNEWWGKGFTEWNNVSKALPLYKGHSQPRIPDEYLGYYDLGDETGEAVQLKQINLAKQYGIHGFCYYYYWFDDGKRLLEKPLDRHLHSDKFDFPFCLCWANENWTRSWDGLNSEVLMPQTYKENWEKKFAEDLIPYVKDERYIKVNGAPYVLIYNLQDIKNPADSISKIRKYCSEMGVERLHISAVRRTINSDELKISGYTIDSLTDFPPHLIGAVGIDMDNQKKYGLKDGQIKDYRKAAAYHANMPKQMYTYFRTAILQWDNTARRGKDAYVFEGFSFEEYKKWLYAIKRYTLRQNRPGEDLMFINAWNEWAEGTYLEPDSLNGFKALETTKEVLEMK